MELGQLIQILQLAGHHFATEFCQVGEGTEMDIEAEGDLQIITTIPFLINLGQVTMVPASIKWPFESSHQKKTTNNQLPSVELCWMPRKAGNSNIRTRPQDLGSGSIEWESKLVSTLSTK